MKCILYVCTGNTCRSPMAQGLTMKYAEDHGLELLVLSAGIFPDGERIADNAAAVLKEKGIDMSFHKPRKLNQTDVDNADLIVCMSKQHAYAVVSIYPSAANKIKIMGKNGIPDPFGGDYGLYKNCLDLINDQIPRIVIDLLEVK